MQEIHPVGAGGRGSLLGGGDSKLRPPHNRQQAINCPRCDSVNTKFCYYNNYNLSQPRHFCKGCRRYWTKGGVLRNVPVGGGCRKPKRSKPNKSPTSTEDPDHHHRINSPPPNRHDNISHSTPQSSSSSRADAGDQSNPCGGVFQFEGIGVVTSLSSTSTTETPSSGCSRVDTGKLSEWQSKNQEWKMQGMVGEWVEDDCYLPWLQSGRSSGGSGGFGQLDWSDAGGEGGLFDLPSSAVDQACWSQSKWNYD